MRIPVVEPWVSRDWYVSVLGFQPVLDLQEAEGLVGVVLRHPTGFVVGLHQDPERARALAGFVILALAVADREGLQASAELLDRSRQQRSSIEEGHLGWYLDVADPDGVLIRLHTATAVDAEEA